MARLGTRENGPLDGAPKTSGSLVFREPRMDAARSPALALGSAAYHWRKLALPFAGRGCPVGYVFPGSHSRAIISIDPHGPSYEADGACWPLCLVQELPISTVTDPSMPLIFLPHRVEPPEDADGTCVACLLASSPGDAGGTCGLEGNLSGEIAARPSFAVFDPDVMALIRKDMRCSVLNCQVSARARQQRGFWTLNGPGSWRPLLHRSTTATLVSLTARGVRRA